jgi:hypothetical protein
MSNPNKRVHAFLVVRVPFDVEAESDKEAIARVDAQPEAYEMYAQLLRTNAGEFADEVAYFGVDDLGPDGDYAPGNSIRYFKQDGVTPDDPGAPQLAYPEEVIRLVLRAADLVGELEASGGTDAFVSAVNKALEPFADYLIPDWRMIEMLRLAVEGRLTDQQKLETATLARLRQENT